MKKRCTNVPRYQSEEWQGVALQNASFYLGCKDERLMSENQEGESACRSVTVSSGVGQRPFKCSYCPYSASQKGNLKTHVLCVHRMPFDNSQYPDRRFKRSRPESDIPEKNPDDAAGVATSNQLMTGADGSHGSSIELLARGVLSRHQD
ncbi:hypothetical protein GBF38_007383 [Nibea albiflora]|uniref:Uncharacterized protein n=1 Tax=Nibea albiflora TaxID=240163 RepID=A0ACB7EIE9_NIBAL|nr:hypothetical protein GBF38_007383 [Nibea albiflora]